MCFVFISSYKCHFVRCWLWFLPWRFIFIKFINSCISSNLKNIILLLVCIDIKKLTFVIIEIFILFDCYFLCIQLYWYKKSPRLNEKHASKYKTLGDICYEIEKNYWKIEIVQSLFILVFFRYAHFNLIQPFEISFLNIMRLSLFCFVSSDKILSKNEIKYNLHTHESSLRLRWVDFSNPICSA